MPSATHARRANPLIADARLPLTSCRQEPAPAPWSRKVDRNNNLRALATLGQGMDVRLPGPALVLHQALAPRPQP